MEYTFQNISQDSGDNNADQNRAAYLAHDQDGGERQADDEHQDGPARQFTVDAQSQWNGGTGLIWDTTHKAGVDQADERDEKANADDVQSDRIRQHETQRFEAGEYQQDHCSPLNDRPAAGQVSSGWWQS